ncbi:MAG TPA: DegV family protein [Candidatus Tumulicola sp.]
MAVAIVTDSTSDIDPATASAAGIAVVPLFVVFGDRSYRDYVDLSREEFYRMLQTQAVLPTTSQPTSAMFESVFAPVAEAGDDILCITISSQLSGTLNSAKAAAGSFPQSRIVAYDSQSVAGGLGMMVLYARELAGAGATIDEIVAALDRWRASQRLYALIADLSHLQRTGRIGRARAALGTLMKVVPVLALKEGSIVAEAQVRTFARARETALDLMMGAVSNPNEARFAIVHVGAPELAESVVAQLRERLNGVTPAKLDVWEAGPVIATHGGLGALGYCVAQP